MTARLGPRLEAMEGRLVLSQVGLTVSSLADAGPGTLRAAILAADVGKPSDKFDIGFSVTGTIDLLSPLPGLDNTIAIRGPGAGSLTIQRESAVTFTSAIVTVGPGQAASLSGLTVANGNNRTVLGSTVGNGGGIANLGVLTVSGCTLAGNVAQHDGGGIWNAGALMVSDSTLSGNGAPGDAGGAIFNDGTLTLANSTVAGNFAAIGGGIENNTGGSATIQQNSSLSGNTAASGAAINNGGTLSIRDSTLSGNSATDFDFGGHHFAGRGGGIDNFGVATIQDSVLSGNTATLGGGIFNEAIATLDVRGSTFTGDTASDSGGALDNLGTATIQESTLSGNAAGSAGGGVFNGTSASLAVDDSTIVCNDAPTGADLEDLGSAKVHDSTIGIIGH